MKHMFVFLNPTMLLTKYILVSVFQLINNITIIDGVILLD